MLGKFKRSLTNRCPLCGKLLEVRVREIETVSLGMEAIEREEYILCSDYSKCHYEEEVEQKRVRRKGKDELI